MIPGVTGAICRNVLSCNIHTGFTFYSVNEIGNGSMQADMNGRISIYFRFE